MKFPHFLVASSLYLVAASVGANSDFFSTAFAQSKNAPSLTSSDSGRGRVQSTNTPIRFEPVGNVTQKKKLSEREKREAKGQGISRSEIETIGLEKELSSALDQEINYMEKLLTKLNKKSDQRPEILRRLIENYHQKAVLTFLRESRKYDADWKKWDASGRKYTEPKLNESASKTFVSRVIQRAQMFITDYPTHSRVDESYFQIGFAMESLGQRKEAASYYSLLVARFPKSARLPDAHFSLGEYYFDKQDYKKALTSYSEATRYQRSPLYPWAVYKIGWTYFNLQNYRGSLASFHKVVALADSSSSLSSASKFRLKEEALRDMVNVYAELGDIDGAESYYSQHGGEKYYGEMLLKLADLLKDRGRIADSVRVLKIYMSKRPLDLAAAETQLQIVQVSSLQADKRLLWAEMAHLLSNYRPDTPWGQKNARDPNLKEIMEKIQATAISYPKRMHGEAQKNKIKTRLLDAEKGYTIYLTYFPNAKDAAEVRFLLGEIQYGLNRFKEAQQSFGVLVSMKEKTPYYQKSAQYLLSSAYLPVEKEMVVIRKRGATLNASPMPIPQTLQDYAKVCAQHIQNFPKDKYVLDCQVDEAEIYLKHNHYQPAEKALWLLANNYAGKKEGEKAAEVLLWLSAGDKKKIRATAENLSKKPEYNRGNFGKRLASIRQEFQFDEAQDIEKGGNHLKAAQKYEELANKNPSDSNADKAYFNAGVNYRKAGQSEKSYAAFSKVYTQYPNSSAGPEALLAMIEMSADRLELENAAKYSNVFLQRYPTDKRAQTVGQESCYASQALKDTARAIQTCSALLKSKDPKVARAAAEVLVEVFEDGNRHRDLVKVIDDHILRLRLTPSERIVYLSKAEEADRKVNAITRSRQRQAEIARIFASNPKAIQGEAIVTIGEMEYKKQLPNMRQYQAVRLRASRKDGSDLTTSIKNKNAALLATETAFKKVVATGDAEYSVAALYTIGQAYEIFANDLKNPPMPPGASAADVQKLREGLANIAKGVAEKSKKYYEEAGGVVAKFGVYSDFSRKNTEALARISPNEYKKFEEWAPDSMYVGSQWVDAAGVDQAIEFLGSSK